MLIQLQSNYKNNNLVNEPTFQVFLYKAKPGIFAMVKIRDQFYY